MDGAQPWKTHLGSGNVLLHYFPADHEIVDKYEKGDGIVNEDIVNFRPGKKYDLIVSISTLEHISWNEEKKPKKIPGAPARMEGIPRSGRDIARLHAPRLQFPLRRVA